MIQIAEALAGIHVFLVGFDQLSPQEAYAKLWRDTLWEACWVEKRTPGALTVIDVSGRPAGPDLTSLFAPPSDSERVQ